MSGECPRPLACSAGKGTAAHALRPRGFYIAAATVATRDAEQTRDLCPAFQGQRRRDADRGRPRSETSRRRDRILQRPAHLEPETPASSARSLRGSSGGAGTRPFTMDRLAAEVRGWTQRTACATQTRLPRNTRCASESESVRGVASSAVPHQMGGLLEASFWRCATCASLSRPVHPPCGNLQPPPRRARRWHRYFPLAR